MSQITDAPAGRVIGLRGVAQLMAQMNLVGGLRRFRLETALLNCPIIRPISSNASFCYTAYHSLEDRLMTQENIQIGAGVLAVILIAIIILRRKGKKKQQEDEF